MAAFNLFDKDNGGTISSGEVRDVLFHGHSMEDDLWKNVMDEVDQDGNGEIDF